MSTILHLSIDGGMATHGLRKARCAECGKGIMVSGVYAYTRQEKGRKIYLCSYGCMRKRDKRREAEREAAREKAAKGAQQTAAGGLNAIRNRDKRRAYCEAKVNYWACLRSVPEFDTLSEARRRSIERTLRKWRRELEKEEKAR